MAKLKKIPGVQIAQTEIPVEAQMLPPDQMIQGDEMNIQADPRSMDIPSEPMNLNVEPPIQPNGLPTSLVESLKSPQDRLMELVNSPEKKALLKQLAEKSQAAVDQQAQGIIQNEDSLKQIEANGPEINYTPGNTLIDQWTGSQFSKNYKAPQSKQEYLEKLLTLKDSIQKQKQGLTTEQINLLKSQLAGGGIKELMGLTRVGQRDAQIGQRDDVIAAQAAQSVHNHPLMQRATAQLAQLNIDRHTVEASKIITPQMLREISNGIAMALSGGKQLGLESGNTQDLSTLQTKTARFEQYLSNHPQDGASPAVRKQIVDTLNRLEDAYGKYQHGLAQKITVGKTYQNSPQAQAAIKAAVDSYTYTPKPQEPEKAPKKTKAPQAQDLNSLSDEELTKLYQQKMGAQ